MTLLTLSVNRTLMELKGGSQASAPVMQMPVNRTLMELKDGFVPKRCTSRVAVNRTLMELKEHGFLFVNFTLTLLIVP